MLRLFVYEAGNFLGAFFPIHDFQCPTSEQRIYLKQVLIRRSYRKIMVFEQKGAHSVGHSPYLAYHLVQILSMTLSRACEQHEDKQYRNKKHEYDFDVRQHLRQERCRHNR